MQRRLRHAAASRAAWLEGRGARASTKIEHHLLHGRHRALEHHHHVGGRRNADESAVVQRRNFATIALGGDFLTSSVIRSLTRKLVGSSF